MRPRGRTRRGDVLDLDRYVPPPADGADGVNIPGGGGGGASGNQNGCGAGGTAPENLLKSQAGGGGAGMFLCSFLSPSGTGLCLGLSRLQRYRDTVAANSISLESRRSSDRSCLSAVRGCSSQRTRSVTLLALPVFRILRVGQTSGMACTARTKNRDNFSDDSLCTVKSIY